MAVTMQQVAELAGVSRGTVDRVLHGRPNVDAVVREKVLRAAEKLGYSCKKTASAPRHRAAILIPQWTDTYFNRQVISGIRRALRYIADDSFELLEVPLRTMTSQELVSAIGQQVENGVDGLIVRAENTPEVYLAIRQALESGIRVITYDGDIPDSGRACFVGQDLMRAGAIAAGVMARLIRYSEHVLVVTGNMRMEAHKGRVDGFCSHLCELGFPSDAYHIIETNEMHSLTEELVAQAISEDRQIRAVYMSTQPVSGCIAGLRRSGVGSGVHVVCNDLTPAAKRYLKEGTVDFVIGQSFWQESFRAVIAMYQLLARNITPKETAYYTDLTLVCKEML